MTTTTLESTGSPALKQFGAKDDAYTKGGGYTKGGAYTNLDDLVRLRYTAAELNNFNTSSSKNPLSGMLTSNFRGRGIDFAEVRLYQPGDDIRTIDWRVTARTRKPHTKLFQEEKEKPVLILVDQSQSMFFGSRRAFKSVLAAETAALLAWSVLDRGDRIGGIVFSEKDHREIRPRRSRHAVLRLLNEIDHFNHQLALIGTPSEPLDQDPLGHALKNVRRVARHGTTLFIVSDFQQFHSRQFQSESLLHLSELSKHNDVVGIFISDPLEQQLPVPDLYTITNGAALARIDTTQKRSRQRYAEQFQQHINRVETEFNRIRAPLIQLRTHENPVAGLIEGLMHSGRHQKR